MNDSSQRRELGLSLAALVVIATAGLPACGGAVQSGVAVGKIGDSLGSHAHVAPQGAEACALQDAVNAAPGAGDKPSSDACGKAVRSDILWRKAMLTLAAYGATLESLSSSDGTTAGPVQGALVGVRGGDWVDAEAADQPARDAIGKLAARLASDTSKGDPTDLVKSAAPQVRTLCDGLVAYLDTQARAFADLQRDVDKKRAARGDRRCAQLDGRSVCVGESVLDRMAYADTYGRLSILESGHLEAKESAASFCAAHRKLEEAAADGRLGKDATYQAVVDAVKAVQRTPPSGAGKATAKK